MALDLRTELAQLGRRIDDLEQESRANFGQVAVAIRKSRLQIQQVELEAAIRRLKPPVAPIDWTPRLGQASTPELSASLIDRLKRGDPVADSIGNIQLFFGVQNVLKDPTFETTRPPTATTNVETVCSRYLLGAPAWYVQDGGTAATGSYGVEYLRDDPQDNPFSSATPRIRLTATGSGTHTLQVRSENWAATNFPILPYLVGAVRVTRLFNNVDTNVTSRRMVLELYDATAAVVRATTTVDLDLLVPYLAQTQISVAVLFDEAAWSANSFQLRIRLELVTTGASGTAYYHLGEPQLTMSFSPDVPPYTPMLGSYHPIKVSSLSRSSGDIVLEGGVVGDTVGHVFVRNDGAVMWGAGSAAVDARLFRFNAGHLRIDPSAASSAVTLSLQAASGQPTALEMSRAGDSLIRANYGEDNLGWGPGGSTARDVRLRRASTRRLVYDADSTSGQLELALEAPSGQRGKIEARVSGDSDHRAALWGDATLAGVEFGPGNAAPDTRAYRNGAGVLKTDGVLEVVGHLRQSGTSFPASPSTSDRYFRSDAGLAEDFRYDGTRWNSVARHMLPLQTVAALPISATGTPTRAPVPPMGTGTDLNLKELATAFFVVGGTALGASHKWVGTFTKNDGSTPSTIATINIDSGASDTWRRIVSTLDVLLGGTSYEELEVVWTKTGTPGNLYVMSTLSYYLVTT